MSGADVELEVCRVIAAPPARVFEAWTSAEELAQWWTPPQSRCAEAAVDLRIGGRYLIVNELPDGTLIRIEGEYLTIDRPRLLRFTWSTDQTQPATEVVTVTFGERPDGTELTVVHERIPSDEARAGHRAGWGACLDGLADHVENYVAG